MTIDCLSVFSPRIMFSNRLSVCPILSSNQAVFTNEPRRRNLACAPVISHHLIVSMHCVCIYPLFILVT